MKKKVLKADSISLGAFCSRIWILKIYRFFGKKIVLEHQGQEYYQRNDTLSDELNNILDLVKIINMTDKKEKLSLIYDLACDYLDKEFQEKNLCQFKNDMCICNRTKKKPYQVGSCCEHLADKSICEHFDNAKKMCTIKSLGCKLFTCPYLWKRGIKYRINQIPCLKHFLSIRQKIIIKCSFFQDKDEVLEKLVKFYKWT